MRFAGIDVGAERHYVAIVDESGAVLQKPAPVSEEATGYRQLRELLGEPQDCLVAMEATGQYWRNLFVVPRRSRIFDFTTQPFASSSLRGGGACANQN